MFKCLLVTANLFISQINNRIYVLLQWNHPLVANDCFNNIAKVNYLRYEGSPPIVIWVRGNSFRLIVPATCIMTVSVAKLVRLLNVKLVVSPQHDCNIKAIPSLSLRQILFTEQACELLSWSYGNPKLLSYLTEKLTPNGGLVRFPELLSCWISFRWPL